MHMAKTSPTQRCLAYCRRQGISAGVTERWIPIAVHPAGGVRRDLFGWIDLIVAWPGEGLIGVQATSGSNASARVSKLLDRERLPDDNLRGLVDWTRSQGRLEVWSWSKRGERGKRKLWTLRRTPVDIFAVLAEGGRAVPGEESPTETRLRRHEAPAGLFPL